MRRRYVTIALLIALVLLLLLLTRKSIADRLKKVSRKLSPAKHGQALTRTTPDSTGKIPAPPDGLRKQAEAVRGKPITADAFALALMLASEGLDDTWKKRQFRAWVAHNDLRELRKRFGWKDLTKLFTYSIRGGQNGFFGKQEKGRRYDTSRVLFTSTLDDAEKLLESFANGPDPTGGATKFIDVRALGQQPGTEGKTLASIEKDWGLKGRLVEGDFYVFGGRAIV